MPDHPRIEELKRRVKNDPASLAFAHLAEEYRRAGRFEDAIETCRAGLAVHPNYLSARVTLGRALIEHGELDAAQTELKAVMTAAPDNLAAIRGLADIHQRRGQNQEALDYYRWALEFAGQDPDLAKQVRELSAAVEPPPPGSGEADRPGAAAAGAHAASAAPETPVAKAQAVPAAEVPPAPSDTPIAPEPPVAPAGEAPTMPAAPAAAEPVAATAAEPVAASKADAQDNRRRLAVYQRLLDAILADRERRQAGR